MVRYANPSVVQATDQGRCSRLLKAQAGPQYNALHELVQSFKAVKRHHKVRRCVAGVTASREGTQTQASDPTEMQQTVTQQMFSRAEKFASDAGPGEIPCLCLVIPLHWCRLVSAAA